MSCWVSGIELAQALKPLDIPWSELCDLHLAVRIQALCCSLIWFLQPSQRTNSGGAVREIQGGDRLL